MTHDRLERITDVFMAARQLDALRRTAFLNSECDGDTELRHQVENLLLGERRTPGCLDQPELMFQAVLEGSQDDQFPKQLSGYKILGVLGHGGMGTVYRAYQPSLDREVALKVIDRPVAPGEMDRIAEEARILACLNHPGIARVHDAGTCDAGVGLNQFIAMELVEGVDLATHARSLQSSRQLLDLMIALCDAVHYAHQKGIIHCDLKPSNVMVNRQGQLKVLDFGIARVFETAGIRPASGTIALIGAPEYMSPEQLTANVDRFDIRSDVYTLGVIACEVFSGHCLNPVDATESAKELIESRNPPPPLRHRMGVFAAELDPVLRQSMNLDPDDRYDSASALAADLKRCRDSEAPLACPATGVRRIRLFCRREPLLSATLTGLALLLIIATTVTTALAWQASKSAATARLEADRTEAANTFLRTIFEYAQPEAARGQDISVRTVLDRAAPTVDVTLADQPRVQAFVHTVYGEAYFAVAEYDLAEQHVRRAWDILLRSVGSRDPETLTAQSNLGAILSQVGRFDEAEGLLLSAHQGLVNDVGDHDERTLQALYNVAALLALTGRFDDAERALRMTLEGRIELLGEQHRSTLTTRGLLGTVLSFLGNADAAGPHLEQALAGLQKTLGPDHPESLTTLSNLALWYSDLGNASRALELAQEELATTRAILGEDHPDTFVSRNNVAHLLMQLDRLAEAETQLRDAIADYRTGVSSAESIAAEGLNLHQNLADVLERRGEYEEAEHHARLALNGRRHLLPAGHPDILLTTNHLGIVLRHLEKYDEAVVEYQRAIDEMAQSPEVDDGTRIHFMIDLGKCLMSLKRYDESEDVLLSAHQRAGISGRSSTRTASALVDLYVASGRPDRAAGYREPASTGRPSDS